MIRAAMPNAAAFVDENLSFSRAVAPSNSTIDTVGSILQDRFVMTSDFAPGGDSTADVTLTESLAEAGYATIFVSANRVLDHEIFARGVDVRSVRPREDFAPGADRKAADAAIEAWASLPSPRFAWVQLEAGHGYLGRPAGHPWPPADAAALEEAWTWHTADAATTDAILPELFALVPPEAGLMALTADHGELFRDRGPFMIGPDTTFGHGEANSPMEIVVPLALRGRGVSPGVRSGAVSALDLHRTLRRAAGLPASTDLRDGSGLRPPVASLCNLLNQEVTEGGGNMSVWVEDDGSQIVRTHAPDVVPMAERPPLLARWPATGVGRQANWTELGLGDLDAVRTRLLFDEALPKCKGFRDLCEEFPELEAIGYIDCD